MADAFKVNLDFLFGKGLDQHLFKCIIEVQQMEEDDKELIKNEKFESIA